MTAPDPADLAAPYALDALSVHDRGELEAQLARSPEADAFFDEVRAIREAMAVLSAATALEPPVALQRLIDYLAQAAAPCALFAMGITLALRPLKRIPAEIGYIVPIKLVAHPVLVYVVLGFVGNFDPLWVYTAVLLASLPTATNVFVIGQQYGVWQERASATILITTLISVLSVSGLLYAIKSGALPPDLFP